MCFAKQVSPKHTAHISVPSDEPIGVVVKRVVGAATRHLCEIRVNGHTIQLTSPAHHFRDGRVLGASQVEYKPFGKPLLKKKGCQFQGTSTQVPLVFNSCRATCPALKPRQVAAVLDLRPDRVVRCYLHGLTGGAGKNNLLKSRIVQLLLDSQHPAKQIAIQT